MTGWWPPPSRREEKQRNRSHLRRVGKGTVIKSYLLCYSHLSQLCLARSIHIGYMEFLPKSYIEAEPALLKKSTEVESEQVKCVCCGLTEECTLEYIEKVRERYLGRWICGLCGEAVKDEIRRSGCLITIEEAIDRHISFFKKFRAVVPPVNPTEHLVAAVRKMMRRCVDSPRPVRSAQYTQRKVVPRDYDEMDSTVDSNDFADVIQVTGK